MLQLPTLVVLKKHKKWHCQQHANATVHAFAEEVKDGGELEQSDDETIPSIIPKRIITRQGNEFLIITGNQDEMKRHNGFQLKIFLLITRC